MAKIVLIGAGSGFGSRLSVDILSFPEFQDAELALVDINAEAAEGVRGFVQRVVDYHKLPAKVSATTDRREALEGADFVVISIAVGGPAYNGVPFYYEIEIPRKYGIKQSVADTITPGGVFRTLRSAPEMLAICHDMEELCPDALLLNYTNPMAMLTWIMSEGSCIRNIGLCHSVQGTHGQLCGYIGEASSDVTSWVAGINHMSWFLRFEKDGVDLYPRLFDAANDPETYAKDNVRFEIMKHFGYFVTESTRHMSEYVPYFRKREDIYEEFKCASPTPSMDGGQAHRIWQDDIPEGGDVEKDALQLRRSGEYASRIMHSVYTDTLFRFNGNVMNDGIIGNLPFGCCVEVPCMTDKCGVNPCVIGDLPTQLAYLNTTNVAVQQLTVEAVLEQDLEKAYQACLLDPLTSAVCSLSEIRSMFNELLEAEQPWLKPFFEM